MSVTSATFVQELLSRQDIVPYVNVKIGSTQTLEVLQQQHVETLGELTNVYNLRILAKPIKKEHNTPDLSSLHGMHKRVYHLMRYIEVKIFKLLKKNHEELLHLFSSLIDYLEKCPPTEEKMFVVVDMEKLQARMDNEPQKVKSLRAHFRFKKGLVGNIAAALKDEEMVRRALRQNIENVALSVDEKTSFFPIHPLQTDFERLFMSKMLPFGDMFSELVADFPPADSQMFLQNLFGLVVECLNSLGINKRPNDAALVLLLVRFIFDRLYATNEYYKNDGEDIIGELKNVTMGYLKPQQDFCPKYEDDVCVRDYFRSDPKFYKAIETIEQVVFQTNPFDILDCVEKSLTLIEAAASYYNDGKTYVFPFEVTFGLFLGVVMSSQVRNWVNISTFVEAYTPLSGLCPSFEFSRTKVVACLMQFRRMAEEIKEGTL